MYRRACAVLLLLVAADCGRAPGARIAGLPPAARVVAQAMKTYSVIVADNGSAWYITGVDDPRWNDDALNPLKSIPGSSFDAVDESSLMADPNSAAVR